MPFTSLQLRQIANVRGQAYIARTRGNRALRVAETYIRRKLYAWEDKAVAREYRLLQTAFADIQRQQSSWGVEVDASWRRQALATIEPRIHELARQVAVQGIGAMRIAYNAGYLGRLWVLRSALRSEVPIQKRTPNAYRLDTEYWWETYQNEADGGILRYRRLLNRAIAERWTPTQALRAIGYELGIAKSDNRGLYYKFQLATRTGIVQASNIGAYEAFVAQISPYKDLRPSKNVREAEGGRDWLLGIMWLSARDSRVCPICARLDGKIWVVSDMLGLALTELPPNQSHDGCRCTIIPMILPNFLKGENEPPESTFNEWLDGEGYDLGEFEDLSIDSTQIGEV